MAPPKTDAVFLNVPFGAAYEGLFVTLVGTLVFLRQDPHCVLEVREQGEGRLTRIFELMRQCRMSVHDLSRAATPARFNMPFELGLACALRLANPARGARELRSAVSQLKRDMKVTSLFRPSMFRHLTAAATKIAIDRGFIPAR